MAPIAPLESPCQGLSDGVLVDLCNALVALGQPARCRGLRGNRFFRGNFWLNGIIRTHKNSSRAPSHSRRCSSGTRRASYQTTRRRSMSMTPNGQLLGSIRVFILQLAPCRLSYPRRILAQQELCNRQEADSSGARNENSTRGVRSIRASHHCGK